MVGFVVVAVVMGQVYQQRVHRIIQNAMELQATKLSQHLPKLFLPQNPVRLIIQVRQFDPGQLQVLHQVHCHHLRQRLHPHLHQLIRRKLKG